MSKESELPKTGAESCGFVENPNEVSVLIEYRVSEYEYVCFFKIGEYNIYNMRFVSTLFRAE